MLTTKFVGRTCGHCQHNIYLSETNTRSFIDNVYLTTPPTVQLRLRRVLLLLVMWKWWL